MAGTAPGLAAGQAGSLPAQVGEMQMIVADQARPPDAQSPIARWRLDHANGRMPVDEVVAMYGREQRQSLHPIDCHPSRPMAPACRNIAGSLSPSMCSDGRMPSLLLRSSRALASLLLLHRAETPSSRNVPKWSRSMSSHSEFGPGLTKDSHLSMLSPGRLIRLKE